MRCSSTYSPYAPSPRVCARVQPSTNSSRFTFWDAILTGMKLYRRLCCDSYTADGTLEITSCNQLESSHTRTSVEIIFK